MRKRSDEIRQYILGQIRNEPSNPVSLAAAKFALSRQGILHHIKWLTARGFIESAGLGRAVKYSLRDYLVIDVPLAVSGDLMEDVIWRENFSAAIIESSISDNVKQICSWGFSEIVNNVIDHSQSSNATLTLSMNMFRIQILVHDDGIGIFRKIMDYFRLDDPRQAMLELSKGKLTTDPDHHSGEGIFFTSKMFDYFRITSNGCLYSGGSSEEQWLFDDRKAFGEHSGTSVIMEISKDSERTTKEVIETYSSTDGEFAFDRTHIPIALAQYEGEILVSRSQAKRLLSRGDSFKEIILDFAGVTEIGQGFADEIFRVFAANHPDIILMPHNANRGIEKMIARTLVRAKELERESL